jgi:hypothetical protein
MSPTVARAVVAGGIERTGIHTRWDLADGLNYALGLLGKAVVATKRSRR